MIPILGFFQSDSLVANEIMFIGLCALCFVLRLDLSSWTLGSSFLLLSFTAKRLRLKAPGCRCGYPGKNSKKVEQPQRGCVKGERNFRLEVQSTKHKDQ